MAGQVGKLTLEAVIEGFEDVQGLGKALKQVAGTANQTDASFKNITTRVKEFARQNLKTTDSIRGQIAAFTKLRGSAAIASDSYTSLTRNIQKLRRELVGLDTAEEKRAKKESLRKIGMSETEIRRAMRSESQIYQRALGQNVWDQTTRSVRQGILDQRVADTPLIIDRKVNQEYVNSFKEATQENNEFTQLQNRLNLKLEAEIASRQVSSQFSTPTVLGPEDDRRFIKRTPRYPGEYGPVFDPANKDIFTKIARASLGIIGEAFPGRKGVGLTGFKPGFTADPDARDYPEDWIKDWKRPMDVARQIVDRRMGGGKRRTSIRAQWGANLRDSKGEDGLFVPENVKKWEVHAERFPGGKYKGGYKGVSSGAGTKYDTWRSRTEVDAPVFYSDIATGDVRARGGRLGRMVGGPSKEVGPSYPQTPAGDAANIEALNKQLANLKTNSQGAKDVRQKLLEIENRMSREMRKAKGAVGDMTRKEQQRVRVQEKLAKIQQDIGGKTGFSSRDSYTYQTRKDIGGGRFEYEERQDAGWARPQVSRDPVTGAMIAPSASGGYAPGSFRMPVPTQVREISGLYDSISRIGMSKISSDIDRMGKSYEEVRKDILAASKAGNKSVQSLNAQRSAFVQLRDGMNPASKGFKQLTKDIQKTDRALARLSNNKFSGANLRRTGQSILGAGFVGGPAGFLGAGLGAGIEALRPGGDMAGGAITGGLVASQVLTPVSQAIGSSTEYASQIEKADIALRGITKTQENYEVALAAAEKATNDYNVPQEVAMKGITRLSAAVLGAGGNIYNAAEAFLNTTVAIKGTAGSAEDVKSAITAMVQIFSKGKVSAEELSGQLGERFPAAVTKFAKANDISTQELQKNLKDGTVGLDMLSKFIESLGKEYEPLAKKIAESNEEAGARAQIAMNRMKIAVGTELKDVGAQFQIIGAELLTSLVPTFAFVGDIASKVFGALATTIKFVIDNFHEFASIAAVAGGAMAAAAISALKFKIALVAWDLKLVISQVVKFIVGLKALTFAQVKANLAAYANPYVALAAGLTAAAIAAHRFATANDRLMAKLNSGSATEDDVTKAFKERLKIQEKIKKLEKEGAGGGELGIGGVLQTEKIENLRAKYDALTEAIEDYRKAQNGSVDDLAKRKKELDSLLGSGDGDASPLEKFAKDGFDFAEQMENAVVGAFKKMEDTLVQFVQTGKLEFNKLAQSIIADMLKISIRQTITKPLMGLIFPDLKLNAKGNAFAANGIVPYRKGGVVSKPTMFEYGGSNLGIMSEAGPEAIIPLKRGRDGKLGVAMQGGRGNGGGTTNVNYTGPTLNFNGDEYVPKSAVGEIVNAAAARGESNTIQSLRHSRSRRANLGL